METRQQAQRHQYTIGWVSALPIELAAAEAMLDEKHETPPQNASDTNIYTLGRVGKHNVVIACLPDSQMGTKSAAVVATQMRSTFPTIVFTLMVGIGGGVPQATLDIRLGDVVVGHPSGSHGGVIQYDFGKATNTGFQRTGFLNTPPTILLNAIARLKANHIGEQPSFRKDVSKLNRIDTFNREVAGPDYLFSADYDHISGDTCERCDRKMLVERTQRDQEAMIHYGTIASGNQVMRNALERDRISSELDGALCFDMEAAGLMNDFQCLVIRGISDYADSHKNKRWQGYAAGTAAAYAKELLAVLPTINVKTSSALEIISCHDGHLVQGIVEKSREAISRSNEEIRKSQRQRGSRSERVEIVHDGIISSRDHFFTLLGTLFPLASLLMAAYQMYQDALLAGRRNLISMEQESEGSIQALSRTQKEVEKIRTAIDLETGQIGKEEARDTHHSDDPTGAEANKSEDHFHRTEEMKLVDIYSQYQENGILHTLTDSLSEKAEQDRLEASLETTALVAHNHYQNAGINASNPNMEVLKRERDHLTETIERLKSEKRAAEDDQKTLRKRYSEIERENEKLKQEKARREESGWWCVIL